jgi:DTW domain-containing protein YfiP
MCYRCFWPQSLCWCGTITPMATLTKFVFLMHPQEYKRTKANTGRLTHLCLADSAIFIGTAFDEHEEVQRLIADPANFPVLLYPARGSRDLSRGELSAQDIGGRRLVVFLLDATWRLARHLWRDSLSLQRLPRVMFSNAPPSRYVIKRQPEPECLSTLEATHELLLALERSGLDHYPDRTQLHALFQRMQDVQIGFAAESARLGRNRHGKERRAGADFGTAIAPKRRRIFGALSRTDAPGTEPAGKCE